MNKDEVIQKAFTRKISTGRIADDMILLCQKKYIRPILTKDFYDLIDASPSSYPEVIEQIKPCLAYFVKYEILPEIWLEITETGTTHIQGKNRTTSDLDGLGVSKADALRKANFFAAELTNFLNDNSEAYSEYYKRKNPENQVIIAGGIIFESTEDLDWDDDDYTQNLT